MLFNVIAIGINSGRIISFQMINNIANTKKNNYEAQF